MSDTSEIFFDDEWITLTEYLKNETNQFKTETGKNFLAFYNKKNIVIIPTSSNKARFIPKEEYKNVYTSENKLPWEERHNFANYPDQISENPSYIFTLINRK